MTAASKFEFIQYALEAGAIDREEARYLLSEAHRWGESDHYDSDQFANEIMMLLDEKANQFEMEAVANELP